MIGSLAFTLLAQGLMAPARIQTWNPDPTLSFELPQAQRFVRSEAKVDGALQLFQDREHPASMILVSFVPNTNLKKQVQSAHEELLRLVPNKRVEPLQSKAFDGIFSKAGLKFAAFFYPSGPATGTTSSICDAAAIHWETGGGVWTVSANGDLGSAKTIQAVLEGFLSSAKLSDLNQPARIAK